MYDIVRGEVVRPSALLQEASTHDADVRTALCELTHEGKEIQKTAAWGSLKALSGQRRIHLWLVEVGSNGMTDDVCNLIEQHKESGLIVMGTEVGVFKTAQLFGQMKDTHPLLWRYKVSTMYLFLREDPPLGSRVPPQANVHRRVLLASPLGFKPHRLHVTTDYNWRSSLLMHMMSVFEMPTRNVITTLLYVPTPHRPESDILVRMGQFLGH